MLHFERFYVQTKERTIREGDMASMVYLEVVPVM
jgi:hypothetical protein